MAQGRGCAQRRPSLMRYASASWLVQSVVVKTSAEGCLFRYSRGFLSHTVSVSVSTTCCAWYSAGSPLPSEICTLGWPIIGGRYVGGRRVHTFKEAQDHLGFVNAHFEKLSLVLPKISCFHEAIRWWGEVWYAQVLTELHSLNIEAVHEHRQPQSGECSHTVQHKVAVVTVGKRHENSTVPGKLFWSGQPSEDCLECIIHLLSISTSHANPPSS